jgi:hypothetical protein
MSSTEKAVLRTVMSRITPNALSSLDALTLAICRQKFISALCGIIGNVDVSDPVDQQYVYYGFVQVRHKAFD